MPKLINICGLGRSGTTLLDLILSNDNQAFSCGEVYAWFRPWRKNHFKLDCTCGKNPCRVWEKIAFVSEDQFHRYVSDQLKMEYIVDSSKEIIWVMDNNMWAKNKDLTVFNLLVWKTPIDSVYSYWKRNRPYTVWRRQFIRYYTRFFQSGLPFVALNFNQFVKNPTAWLAKICNIFEMPYFNEKIEFWRKEHHQLYGNQGTRTQLVQAQSLIRSETQFPNSFRKEKDQLMIKISNDAKICDILDQLQSRTIKLECSSNGPKMMNETTEESIQKPYWYFAEKIKQIIRRKFPVSITW